jgi:tetratricopeptide (TPR) repeat protein
VRGLGPAARAAALAFGLLAAGACSSAPPAVAPSDGLAALRAEAAGSKDGQLVGRWLFAELLMPGGTPKGAREARAALDRLSSNDPLALLAKAVDDDAHGRLSAAADGYLAAVSAARVHEGPHAALLGWFAAQNLVRLRSSIPNLWQRARPVVTEAVAAPVHLGFRARGKLADWWALEVLPKDEAARHGKSPLEATAALSGCVEKARLAGPFGHLAPSDDGKHWDAERAGPWPAVFPADARRREPPRTITVERVGCRIGPSEPVAGGVFYTETYVDLPAEREVIVAVQAAVAVFVDDHEVLTRDSTAWGIWPRFAARVRLGAGRHRILARIVGPETAIRLLDSVGAPLGIATSADPTAPYADSPPRILTDPNPLAPFLEAVGIQPQPGAPPSSREGTSDPVLRFIAAQLADVEGQADLSSVLIEPLVADVGKASALALATQATFVERDPIFPETDARDLARSLRQEAAKRDPDLWWTSLWLVLDELDKRGAPEVLPQVSALAERFREVPELTKALASLYGRQGWSAERVRTIEEAEKRFPEDLEVLSSLLDVLDQQGRTAEADAVAQRIERLNPDAEITFQRALARRDFPAAIAELEKLGERRADRKDIAARIADLLTRAGKRRESMEFLERAVERDPSDAGARLALSDARFASGDGGALRKALVDAIEAGAETDGLRGAIELIEGITELDPFRQDGKKVIAAYEASGEQLTGNAARVLDYAAMWVHEDGSARMLEHEIIHIQSREAIAEHAEQRLPRGIPLRLRTIKKDGRVLEPEVVDGKPTVTMPHLEVGDFIETETLMSFRGDGRGGRRFEGPRWFFREEKLSYWRSEFVIVTPKTRPLDVEVGGNVPPAEVSEDGALVTRRWRVDKTPALPEEPASAPISEFLPNVRVGWGTRVDELLAEALESATDQTPVDPRLARVARTIVGDAKGTDEKARRLYRWVLANVEPGRESDPRRVVIGKVGNTAEAFRYLARLVGLDVAYGLVRDRLVEPPRGPMSEAEQWSSLALRLRSESGPRWLIVSDKYAPFGHLPSALRGQPAVVLVPGLPRESTTTGGTRDAVVSEGTVELAADGSATIALEQRYEGKFAIGLRRALESIADAELEDAIQARLLPNLLPGARLLSLQVKELASLDVPLTLSMKLEMPSFARPREGGLVISPPFAMELAGLASLPSRETPLFVSEQMTTRSEVRLVVQLPKGARVSSQLASLDAKDPALSVSVADRAADGTLTLTRTVDLPAGRILPTAYPSFQSFARSADAALHRDVLIELGR